MGFFKRLIGAVFGALAHALIVGLVLGLGGALVGTALGFILVARQDQGWILVSAAFSTIIAGSAGAVGGAIYGLWVGMRREPKLWWVIAGCLFLVLLVVVMITIPPHRFLETWAPASLPPPEGPVPQGW